MIFTQEALLTRKWFSGRSCIRSNWNLEMLIFEEGKVGYEYEGKTEAHASQKGDS